MGTIFAMLYSDGNVEYRDRMSMEVLLQDHQEFLNLGQVGFNPLMRPCESVSARRNCSLMSMIS